MDVDFVVFEGKFFERDRMVRILYFIGGEGRNEMGCEDIGFREVKVEFERIWVFKR